MYLRWHSATNLMLHFKNRWRLIYLLNPPNQSRLKSKCIGVGTLSCKSCYIFEDTGRDLFVRRSRPTKAEMKNKCIGVGTLSNISYYISEDRYKFIHLLKSPM